MIGKNFKTVARIVVIMRHQITDPYAWHYPIDGNFMETGQWA